MLLSQFQWEASFAFNILSIIGASVQFAPAVSSLPWPILLLLPGWDQPPGLVLFPFPCTGFPNLCKQPSCHEWYPFTLQTLDPCLSLDVFWAALDFVRTFVKLLQFAHLKTRISQVGKVDCQESGMAGQGQVLNALTLGSEVPLKPCGSFH